MVVGSRTLDVKFRWQTLTLLGRVQKLKLIQCGMLMEKNRMCSFVKVSNSFSLFKWSSQSNLTIELSIQNLLQLIIAHIFSVQRANKSTSDRSADVGSRFMQIFKRIKLRNQAKKREQMINLSKTSASQLVLDQFVFSEKLLPLIPSVVNTTISALELRCQQISSNCSYRDIDDNCSIIEYCHGSQVGY